LRGLDKFLLTSGALIIVASLTVRHLSSGASLEELSSLKAVFPQADRFVPQKEPCSHHQAIASNWQTGESRLVGYCFDTAQVVPQVRGFGDPIHILVGVDLDGTVVGMAIADHHETPAYAESLREPWFAQQFVGRRVGDAFQIGQDLNGISGATITSRAVARDVREGLAAMAGLFPEGAAKRSEPPEADRDGWLKVSLLVVLMALCLVAFWRRKRALRPVSLVLGLALVGFYLNGSLSVVHIVNVLSLRFPSFSDHLMWYLVLLFGVATALFLGRLYCGWICPFGALQELFKKIVPYRVRPSPIVHRRASQLRKVLLWLVVCLVFIGGSQGVLRYEPFATAFGLRGTALMWAILAVVLLASLVIDRFWCRYFCAVGATLHLLGKLGLRKGRSSSPSGEQIMGDF